jgi:UDP-glucose 4-epimerase
MLEVARHKDVGKFVYVSSAGVYSPVQDPDVTIDENYPVGPKGMYSVTKYTSELLVKEFAEDYGVPAHSVRITAPYGPGMRDKEGLAAHTLLLAERIVRGTPINMPYGGDHTVNYTFVKDVAKGIHLATKSNIRNYEVFNVAGGKNYKISELAEACRQISPSSDITVGGGTLVNSKSTDELLKPLPQVQARWDIAKAKKKLNYEPSYDLKRGMTELIAHLRNME